MHAKFSHCMVFTCWQPGIKPHTLAIGVIILGECTTLWGEPEQVHMYNMEQLHALDCHQNVTGSQGSRDS